MEMKVGIMGGTFDPIHIGHLIAADKAKEGLSLDEVWFIPSYQPPHKTDGPQAGIEERWEMVCQSIKCCTYFKAMDIEIKKQETSYSIYTARTLNHKYPQYEFYYIIGADMIQYLPQWYKIEELKGLVSFIGLERAGCTIQWDLLPESIRQCIHMVNMPMIEVSSTKIREHCSRNESIRFLVSENVRKIIEVNQLYGS